MGGSSNGVDGPRPTSSGRKSALYDRLAAQKLLAPLELPKTVTDAIPATIGKPKAVSLKDPNGFWVGTVLESCGIAYHPRLLQRLGVQPPKDWDDLLDPRLKGNVAQAPPTRSSSSHAAYEVILQRDGDAKGWEWLKRLAANTGIFAPRSRDVPAMVARGEFAVGFAVPSYLLSKIAWPATTSATWRPERRGSPPGPQPFSPGQSIRRRRALSSSSSCPSAAKDRDGSRPVPIVPKYRIQGPPGPPLRWRSSSTAACARISMWM